MLDRAYLKAKGKNAFQRNYWMCVLVAFILAWCIGSSGGSSVSGARSSLNNMTNSSSSSSNSYSDLFDDDDFDFLDDLEDSDHGDSGSENLPAEFWALFGPMLIVICLVVFVISLAFMYFVKRPLSIGARRYFVVNSFEKPQFGELGFGFRKGQYMDIVKSTFMRDLFIALWSIPTYICFIAGIASLFMTMSSNDISTGIGLFFTFYIIGLGLLALPIYKTYQYYLVDYILSEDPHIGYKAAIDQSKMMMDGYKWATFVFQLSFIGWHLLNVFTCGLLGIFWTNPYVYASEAELFLEIRKNHFGPNVQPYYIPAFPGGNGGYGAPVGGYGAPNGYNGGMPQAYNPPQQYVPGQFGSANDDPYAQPVRPTMPNTPPQQETPAQPERKIQMPSSTNNTQAGGAVNLEKADTNADPYGQTGSTLNSDPYADPYGQAGNTTPDPYGQTGGSTLNSDPYADPYGQAGNTLNSDPYGQSNGTLNSDSSDYYSPDQGLNNDPFNGNNNDPYGG